MATAKNASAAPAKKRTPNAAFMKPLTPSPALAAVVGSTPLPRTEIISKVWVYIKEHKLQDASNKRMINADGKLKEVFGKPQVSMFEMAGLIGKHVKKARRLPPPRAPRSRRHKKNRRPGAGFFSPAPCTAPHRFHLNGGRGM